MLETLYNFAKEHKSQVVKFNYKEYNDYSGKYKDVNFAEKLKKDYNYDLIKTPYYAWRLLKKDCLSNLGLPVWAHFYLTEFIKSNSIQFAPSKHGEDHLFAYGALLLANKIDFLNKYFYVYRIRSGSAVRIKSDMNFCVFNNTKLLKEFIISNNLWDELSEEWIKYARNVASWHYQHISDKSIEKYEKLCRQYFSSEKEFKSFRKKIKQKRSFLEQIFSLKNKILGINFLIKPKKKEVRCV